MIRFCSPDCDSAAPEWKTNTARTESFDNSLRIFPTQRYAAKAWSFVVNVKLISRE